MSKQITLSDCQELYDKFIEYTETAEQHEFPILAQIQLMMEASLKKWQDPLDQAEAAAMFRVVKKVTGIAIIETTTG
jgi:F420-dependent methylenetetrahydromethanopterin dehydrogenase